VHDAHYLIQNASFLLYGLIISLIFPIFFIANLIHIINLPMLNIMIDQLFKLSPAESLKKVELVKKVCKIEFLQGKIRKIESFYEVKNWSARENT